MEYQYNLYRDDLPLIGDLEGHKNRHFWYHHTPLVQRCQAIINLISKLGLRASQGRIMGGQVAIFSIALSPNSPRQWCAIHISDGRTIYALDREPEVNAGVFKTLSLANKAILLPELIKDGYDGVVRHLEL